MVRFKLDCGLGFGFGFTFIVGIVGIVGVDVDAGFDGFLFFQAKVYFGGLLLLLLGLLDLLLFIVIVIVDLAVDLAAAAVDVIRIITITVDFICIH